VQQCCAITQFEAEPFLWRVFTFHLGLERRRRARGGGGEPNCVSGPGESGLLRPSSIRRSRPAAPSVNASHREHHFRYFCIFKSDSVINRDITIGTEIGNGLGD
jgi:hypothetical protein